MIVSRSRAGGEPAVVPLRLPLSRFRFLHHPGRRSVRIGSILTALTVSFAAVSGGVDRRTSIPIPMAAPTTPKTGSWAASLSRSSSSIPVSAQARPVAPNPRETSTPIAAMTLSVYRDAARSMTSRGSDRRRAARVPDRSWPFTSRNASQTFVPPSNDAFEQAKVIDSLPFSDALETDGATRSEDDPYDAGSESPTVWYALTPASSGLVRAHTFGSATPSALSVFSGERGSLQEIVRAQEYGSGSDYGHDQPLVIFEATAGVTYHIMVDTEGGTLHLEVDSLGPPAITPLPDSSAWAGGSTSGVILLDGDRRRLFMTRSDSSVTVFDADEAGYLTSTGSSPTPSPSPTHMAINPAGDRLYVSAGLGISVHSIAPDGTLTWIQTAGIAEGGSFNSLVYVPLPDGDHFYVNDDIRGDGNNIVSAFRVEVDGSLTHEDDYPTGGAGGGGYFYGSPALRSAGRRLFALNGSIELGSNDISVFDIGIDGRLTPVSGSPFPLAESSQTSGAIAVNAAGTAVYAGTADGRVIKYTVAEDGSLDVVGVFSIGGFLPILNLELDPAGSVLAATFESTNHLALADTASMTPLAGSPIVAVAYHPSGMAFSSDGSRLFVGDLSSVVVYDASLVHPDLAPMLQCPEPVAVPCTLDGLDVATLRVHVEDPEGEPLTVTWSIDGSVVQVDQVPAHSPSDLSLTKSFPLGEHGVEIAASDNRSESRCATQVRVTDDVPPVLSASLAVGRLWPAASELVNVGLTTSTNDCSPNPRIEVSVFSDENQAEQQLHRALRSHAHAVILGSPDASELAPGTLQLRAERDPLGDGRVYLVVTRAIDEAGNSSFRCSTAIVPRRSSPSSIQTTESQADAARAYCEANGGNAPPGYFPIGSP